MPEPKQPKKRLVSKTKYAAHLAEKATLKTGSFVMLVVGAALCLVACLSGISAFLTKDFVPLIMALLFLGVAGIFLWGGADLYKTVADIEPVLPLTRQGIEQLPAEETLVRASAEPTAEQEKTLLRATTGGAETSPEQLLRPPD